MARIVIGKVVGEKGEPFKYEDFTQDQLNKLKGPKGDKGDKGLQGPKGDSFKYEDFTPTELEGLKGPKGDKGDKGDTGTTDYNQLQNIPTINGQPIQGEIVLNTGSYNNLTDKPALNGIELNSMSKIKTLNGSSIIGEGDINVTGETGIECNSAGEGSHAEGFKCDAYGRTSHAEGANSQTGWYTHSAHAEGFYCKAVGNYSHAEGNYTIAGTTVYNEVNGIPEPQGNCSHAEGKQTYSFGEGSHAEGDWTMSIGDYSHAEGGNCKAGGEESHTEGIACQTPQWIRFNPYNTSIVKPTKEHWDKPEEFKYANNQGSHAEGFGCNAWGEYSHAEGIGNKVNVFNADSLTPEYNSKDLLERGVIYTLNSIGCAEMVYKRDSSNILIETYVKEHKNAFEVLTNGNIYMIGVNGYDGTNTTLDNSVQNLIQSLCDRITALENKLNMK